MRKSFPRCLVPLLVLLPIHAIASPAADETSGHVRLVNTEGAATTPRGAVQVGGDVRFIDSPESIIYSSAELRYGLLNNLELGIRGTSGSTRSLRTASSAIISHGGSDAELFVKCAFGGLEGVRLAALGGVSFPATPAQNQAIGTFSGIAAMNVHRRVSLYLNPRAAFVRGSAIVGIGGGASINLSDRVSLVGDYTVIVSGMNTRSVADGSSERVDIWGAALRFTSPLEEGQIELDLGWGNAAGSTTGMSLTPGLNHANGAYVALRIRR